MTNYWKSGMIMLAMTLAVFAFPSFTKANLGLSSYTNTSNITLNIGDVVSVTNFISRLNTSTTLTVSVSMTGYCPACFSGSSTMSFAIGEQQKQYNYTLTNVGLVAGNYKNYIQFLETAGTGDIGLIGLSVVSGVSQEINIVAINGVTPTVPTPPIIVGGGGGRTTLPEIKAEPATLPVIIVPDIEPTLPVIIVPEIKAEPVTLPVIIIPDIEPTEPVHPLTTIPWQAPIKAIAENRSITFAEYFSDVCTTNCDVNDDGFVDFADVVTEYVILQNKSLPKVTGTPPVLAGAPNIKEGVRLYLQEGKLTGKYDFTLTAMPTVIDDTVTFYAMVDTGPTGIIAVDSFIRFDSTILSFIDMDSVGSILQSSFLVNDQIESGVLRLAGVTNTPFVGTNGYISALRFKVLREGSANLTIANASVYQYAHKNPKAIILQGIDGIFSLPPKKDIIPTVVQKAERNICACLLPNNRLLCLLLFMVTFGAVLSIILLIVKYQKKEK